MEQWGHALKILGKIITKLRTCIPCQTTNQVLGQAKDILKHPSAWIHSHRSFSWNFTKSCICFTEWESNEGTVWDLEKVPTQEEDNGDYQDNDRGVPAWQLNSSFYRVTSSD